jgi:hypothetical protein
MIAATLLLAALIAYRFAPLAWRQARLLYWQSRCMNYSAPADRIVYSTRGSVWVIPAEWSKFYALMSPPGLHSEATVFLRERISPMGNRRLVAVDMLRANHGMLLPVGRVIIPGSAIASPTEYPQHRGIIPEAAVDSDSIIIAGQPDAVDASHFTIRMIENGTQMIFDGWLRDDDQVLLEPRPTPPPPSTQSVP